MPEVFAALQVRNFGVAGATAQKFADQPYWEELKHLYSADVFASSRSVPGRSGNSKMCGCVGLTLWWYSSLFLFLPGSQTVLRVLHRWRPHFVVLLFGTNDAKSSNWDAESFQKDELGSFMLLAED